MAESLVGELDEKERDFERSGTVRAEYVQDVEEIQFWLQRAEAKVQDRGLEPFALKAQLQVRTSKTYSVVKRTRTTNPVATTLATGYASFDSKLQINLYLMGSC